MEQSTAALEPRGIDLGQPVIDVDIHCTVPSAQALFPYLSAHWREYLGTSALKGPTDTAYPGGAPRRPPAPRPPRPPPGRGRPAGLLPRPGPRASAGRLERRGRHPQLRL